MQVWKAISAKKKSVKNQIVCLYWPWQRNSGQHKKTNQRSSAVNPALHPNIEPLVTNFRFVGEQE